MADTSLEQGANRIRQQGDCLKNNRERPVLDVSNVELVQLQNEDETLARVRGMAE